MRRRPGSIAVVTLAIVAGMAALGGQQSPAFDVTEVAANVYTFRWHTHRNMFVITDDGVVVTDPISREAAEALDAEIRRRTSLPVTHVIYSHEHWDHVLGAGVFADSGATVISHARCVPSFEENPNDDLVPPDVTFDGDVHELRAGGRAFELRYLGPSHGACLIVVRLPGDGIVYTPDLVTPRTLGYRTMPDYQPLELIRALRRLETEVAFDRIIPGHGPPVADASAVVEERRYFETLVAEVKRHWDDGVRDPAQLARSVELPQYRDWAGYEWLALNVERVWASFHMGW